MAETRRAGVSGLETISRAQREWEEIHTMYGFAVAFRPPARVTRP